MSSIEIVFNLDILGSVDDNLTRPPKVIEGFKPHKNLTKYCRLCYIQIKYSELLFQMFSLLKMSKFYAKAKLKNLFNLVKIKKFVLSAAFVRGSQLWRSFKS